MPSNKHSRIDRYNWTTDKNEILYQYYLHTPYPEATGQFEYTIFKYTMATLNNHFESNVLVVTEEEKE
jgi:hypothetical protein